MNLTQADLDLISWMLETATENNPDAVDLAELDAKIQLARTNEKENTMTTPKAITMISANCDHCGIAFKYADDLPNTRCTSCNFAVYNLAETLWSIIYTEVPHRLLSGLKGFGHSATCCDEDRHWNRNVMLADFYDTSDFVDEAMDKLGLPDLDPADQMAIDRINAATELTHQKIIAYRMVTA